MKTNVIGIIMVMVSVVVMEMGCVALSAHNYAEARRFVQEMKNSDEDGGHATELRRHGLLGYEVEYWESWTRINNSETFVFGF